MTDMIETPMMSVAKFVFYNKSGNSIHFDGVEFWKVSSNGIINQCSVKGFSKSCTKCYYWTGKGGRGQAYKCYCGSCPAKRRDYERKEYQKKNRRTGI